MPATAISLQLPQPCAESWEAMTPTDAGRHCAACQHEVVDFTAFTDGELAAYLARPGKLACGRFRASQLGRVLLPAAVPVAGWRRWWGAVAAVLGLGALATPARAQQGQPHAATQQPTKAVQPLGRVVPSSTSCTKPPHPASVPMLQGEPMLSGAPMAVPVTMGRPALPPKKKK